MLKRTLHRLMAACRIAINPISYARSVGVRLGDGCRLINLSLETFGSEPYLIKLGHRVTVGEGVRFLTHDGGVWVFRQAHPDIDVFGSIVVGNNVFIGTGAIILLGATIGDNSVIGAGAVVTGDIPPGSIAAGVPAKPIKTINDYWKDVENRCFHLRSLPSHEKRSVLERHFWGGDS